METAGNLELPSRMSSCVRFFIETLLDETGVRQGASWRQGHEPQSAFPKVTKKKEESGHAATR